MQVVFADPLPLNVVSLKISSGLKGAAVGRAGVRSQKQGGSSRRHILLPPNSLAWTALGHNLTTPPGAMGQRLLTFRMRTAMKAMEKMIIILMNWL